MDIKWQAFCGSPHQTHYKDLNFEIKYINNKWVCAGQGMLYTQLFIKPFETIADARSFAEKIINTLESDGVYIQNDDNIRITITLNTWGGHSLLLEKLDF